MSIVIYFFCGWLLASGIWSFALTFAARSNPFRPAAGVPSNAGLGSQDDAQKGAGCSTFLTPRPLLSINRKLLT